MGSPEIDVEARLRRALTEVTNRIEPATSVARPDGSIPSARLLVDGPRLPQVPGGVRQDRGAWRWVVAASVLALVVVGVAVLVARAGGPEDGLSSIGPPAERPLVVTQDGVTVTATVVVGGGERCLAVSAVDARGSTVEVVPGGGACVPAAATDQVSASTATVVDPALVVVTGLAGSDYRSLSAVLAAVTGPDVADRFEGPSPAILLVIPRSPGWENALDGELAAHIAPGTPDVRVPIGQGITSGDGTCIRNGGGEICVVDDGSPGISLRAAGLAPGSTVDVHLDGASFDVVVDGGGEVSGSKLGVLSLGAGDVRPSEIEVTGLTATGQTIEGMLTPG